MLALTLQTAASMPTTVRPPSLSQAILMKQDRPRRTFNPEMTARYGRPTFHPFKLVKYSQKWEHARLMNFPFKGSHWRPRMRSVVIAIDGGSRGNNKANPNSRAAYGVFWGPSSAQFGGPDRHYNRCGLLRPEDCQTNQRAELEAVRQALVMVNARKAAGQLDGWREIILKTDSDWVHKTFNEYVWYYVDHGWRRMNGKPVQHGEVIGQIHQMILDIEREGAVRFWRVGREWNRDADALVKVAFQRDNSDSGYEET